MGKPKKPLYADQIYYRVEQQLQRQRLRTVAETGGQALVDRQKYISRQPTADAKPGSTLASLDAMQRELFGELATLASEASRATKPSRRASRDILKEGPTERIRDIPGISGLQSGELEFMPGNQSSFQIRRPIASGDSTAAGSYIYSAGFTGPSGPYGNSGPDAVTAITPSAELNTLLVESATMAGIPLVAGEAPKDWRKGGKTEAVAPRDRAARIEAAQRARSSIDARERSTRVYADSQYDNKIRESATLGTAETVGAGTLLGSNA